MAMSEKGEGYDMHQLCEPSKCLATSTGSQVTRSLPCGPWPVALLLAVTLLDHLCLQPQVQSHRGQGMARK